MHAKVIVHMYAQTHRFCHRCGAPTVAIEAGLRRKCVEAEHKLYPRTDPVVSGRIHNRAWTADEHSSSHRIGMEVAGSAYCVFGCELRSKGNGGFACTLKALPTTGQQLS